MRETGQTTVGLHLQESGVAPEKEVVRGGEKKILVVDNDSFVREIIAKILNNHLGLEVVTAVSGSKAIAESLSGEYIAAVIELMLPETSGVEAIKAIKAMLPEFPIIAIAANAEAKRDALVKKYGIKQLFYKPVKISAMINELKSILLTGREEPVVK